MTSDAFSPMPTERQVTARQMVAVLNLMVAAWFVQKCQQEKKAKTAQTAGRGCVRVTDDDKTLHFRRMAEWWWHKANSGVLPRYLLL